jgi:hypothetical protein
MLNVCLSPAETPVNLKNICHLQNSSTSFHCNPKLKLYLFLISFHSQIDYKNKVVRFFFHHSHKENFHFFPATTQVSSTMLALSRIKSEFFFRSEEERKKKLSCYNGISECDKHESISCRTHRTKTYNDDDVDDVNDDDDCKEK